MQRLSKPLSEHVQLRCRRCTMHRWYCRLREYGVPKIHRCDRNYVVFYITLMVTNYILPYQYLAATVECSCMLNRRPFYVGKPNCEKLQSRTPPHFYLISYRLVRRLFWTHVVLPILRLRPTPAAPTRE